jgi:hypothetical protein
VKRGDIVIRNGERYVVNAVEGYGSDQQLSLVREGSLAHAVNFPPSDLRSHELPRNSGEVAAVNGPTTLGEKAEAIEPNE